MSLREMRRQHFSFLALFFEPTDVKVLFSLEKNGREVSSDFAQVQYLIEMLAKKCGSAVKKDALLFCAVVALSESSHSEQTGCNPPHI